MQQLRVCRLEQCDSVTARKGQGTMRAAAGVFLVVEVVGVVMVDSGGSVAASTELPEGKRRPLAQPTDTSETRRARAPNGPHHGLAVHADLNAHFSCAASLQVAEHSLRLTTASDAMHVSLCSQQSSSQLQSSHCRPPGRTLPSDCRCGCQGHARTRPSLLIPSQHSLAPAMSLMDAHATDFGRRPTLSATNSCVCLTSMRRGIIQFIMLPAPTTHTAQCSVLSSQ
jgi:hypothetical protein